MLLPFMKEKKLKDEKSLDPLKSRSSVYGSAPFHFTTLMQLKKGTSAQNFRYFWIQNPGYG